MNTTVSKALDVTVNGMRRMVTTNKNSILAEVKTGFFNKKQERIVVGAGLGTATILLGTGIYKVINGSVLVGVALGVSAFPAGGLVAAVTAWMLYEKAQEEEMKGSATLDKDKTTPTAPIA